MKIATLVIVERVDEVLLGLKRNGCEIGDDTLNGPGGKLKFWETLLMCALRETWEEARILLNPFKIKKVAIITFYAGGIPSFKVHVYRTRSFIGKPRETKSMVPGWYRIENLPVDRMLESDRHWFPQLIRGDKFNANVYYREKAKGFLSIEFLPFIP